MSPSTSHFGRNPYHRPVRCVLSVSCTATGAGSWRRPCVASSRWSPRWKLRFSGWACQRKQLQPVRPFRCHASAACDRRSFRFGWMRHPFLASESERTERNQTRRRQRRQPKTPVPGTFSLGFLNTGFHCTINRVPTIFTFANNSIAPLEVHFHTKAFDFLRLFSQPLFLFRLAKPLL